MDNILPLMIRLQTKCEELGIKIEVENETILLNDREYYYLEDNMLVLDYENDYIPLTNYDIGSRVKKSLLQFVTYVEHNKIK